MTKSRRQFLAGAALGIAGIGAGCLWSENETSLSIETVTDDRSLGEKAAYMVSTDDYQRDGLLSGGHTTEERESKLYRRPLLLDGNVYNVEVWINNPILNGYTVTFTPVEEQPDGEGVDFADLPAVDRKALDFHRWRLENGEHASEPDPIDGILVYEKNSGSALVPEQSVSSVIIDGAGYHLDINDKPLKKYTYIESKRATSIEAFGEQLRAEFLFELSGLSEDEQDILNEARDEGSYYTNGSDEDYNNLMNRFAAHQPPINHYKWIFNWQGSTYWATVSGLESDPEIEGRVSVDPYALSEE